MPLPTPRPPRAAPAALLALSLTVAVPPLRAADVAAPRPALTVTVTTPQPARWSQTVAANGSVTAWQEAIIGAEVEGLRLTAVEAQVGDRVKRGQLLAQLAADTLKAEAAPTAPARRGRGHAAEAARQCRARAPVAGQRRA